MVSGAVDETYCPHELCLATAVRAFWVHRVVTWSATRWALVYESVSISYSNRNSSSQFLRVARSPLSGQSLNKCALAVVNVPKRPNIHFRLHYFLCFLLSFENRLSHNDNHPFLQTGTGRFNICVRVNKYPESSLADLSALQLSPESGLVPDLDSDLIIRLIRSS